jgi:hypothetical protein
MSDDIFDSTDEVVGVLTEQIEAHFGMGMDQLRAAVSAAPTANPAATEVVKWHGLLADSQSAVGRAEDALLASLDTPRSEVDDPTLGFAHRLDAAVKARDGRAQVVRWLLDPAAPGKQGLAAERLARLGRGARTGPAVQTSPPCRPASAPATTPRTGRAAQR